jgi:short-subunit dehydrogenase
MSKEKKFVLVTGAANGIGLAITEYLAVKGDFVFATDIDMDSLEQLKGRENIAVLHLDVTDRESITKAINEISKISNGLDALVNNAGVFAGGPLVEVPDEDMDLIVKVNILGVYNVTKQLFPLLFKKKGRVINIGSEAGRLSWPLNGPYSMTKFALESFSDSLRRELMFLGMKVVNLQVGAMSTNFLERTYYCYSERVDINTTNFPKLINSVLKVCEGEKTKAANPIAVGKKVYKAIHKKRPKARYRVKNDKLRRMTEFLPSSLLDFILKKMFKQ